ncbi:pre-rRNA-processing protein TSR1 homolog isoform X1 [Leptopilina boulardi]|uniref:pre-rRNA-processing protein TSR1 homolog isoform X1 n=1 Tax=Leptopilina boulardi TaxID=63433 RepID=UPI0021F50D14|nr:pre-rRNA-processing protein TSR1 homolog isoform X1 [Leptopilina boulardi]
MSKHNAHRPGAFKQVNKTHKTGRHRSKGAISNEVKGKVNVKTLSKRIKGELGREARRHQAQQIRQNKRDEVLKAKRGFGCVQAPPILVTLIPLQKELDTNNVVSIFKNVDESANISFSPCGSIHLGISRIKRRFSLIIPPVGDVISTLDAAKVSDTVMFLVSAKTNNEGDISKVVDSWGQNILPTVLAQGLPAAAVALTNLENIPIKKRQKHKQFVENEISKWLPDEKILLLDNNMDGLNILRRIGSQKQKKIFYRSRRPYLIAETIKYTSQNSDDNNGTLEVSGYLRGQPLSANELIHLTGFGDFQISRIDAPEDPYSLEKERKKSKSSVENNTMDCETVTKILEEADASKQESLQAENILDPMDAEQTWPTEDELIEAENSTTQKLVKVVPKGTSVYQAAWIPDEDAENIDDLSESEDEMSVEDDIDSDNEHKSDDEEYESVALNAPFNDDHYDEDIDILEEIKELKKIKEAKADKEFPDELDTPQNMLAKLRFQKYRGLESFRTTPWDVKENLPRDYARIFQFENFERTRKRILKNAENKEDGVSPGSYITIHVKNFSKQMFEMYCSTQNRPLIIFGLLPHEQKISLVNVVLKRAGESLIPIKSKERLIFQCGFRRFSNCPIFSQHTNGNKHKYERFIQPESTVAASMYAPIMYSPCPVLCFRQKASGTLDLVATGSVLSANADRLVVKRVILSGHPFKVHKRSAVIRFMFFNREDINWFKPVQVVTKFGRRGHIKEPLGTHGHMKCHFDGQLKSQDTVLMKLYKRVFPKWKYEPYFPTISSNSIDEEME